MFTRLLHKTYNESLDLTGKDLLTLTGAPRQSVLKLIPFLADPTQMSRRFYRKKKATAMNGEVATEIHQFKNITQGDTRLTHLLFRNDRLIQITFHDSSLKL